MKKSIVATLIAAALVAAPIHVNAAELERQQQGGGIGLLLGAIAGGPLGAVIGGAVGAGVGHDMDREAAFGELNGALEEERAAAARLREKAAALEEALAEAKAKGKVATAADNNLLLALSAGVSQKIHFRGGSDRLEPFELERLTALAAFLEAVPGLKLALAGYADPRGGEQANLALSERRVAVVRGALERAGVDGSRIEASAFGERRTLSQPGDGAAYPFDRRVTVTLVVE